MGEVVEVVEIRCHECLALFFVCEPCFRGHGYCAEECRVTARRRQLRAANARHQRTEEGREDHRDRQRELRRRQRERSGVTDQGSAIYPADFTVSPADAFVGDRSNTDEQSETIQRHRDRAGAPTDTEGRAQDEEPVVVVVEHTAATGNAGARRLQRCRFCGVAGTHVVTSGLHGFRLRRGPALTRVRGG